MTDWLDPLLKAFGPVGAALVLAGYVYRRDLSQERRRTEAREDRMIEVLEANAASNERLVVAAEKIEHAANNLLEHLTWTRRMSGL